LRQKSKAKQPQKDISLVSGIANKLTPLMGGAVLLTGSQASANSIPVFSTGSNNISLDATSARKPFPAKLMLKQQVIELLTVYGFSPCRFVWV
jgi:hypothetical protein